MKITTSDSYSKKHKCSIQDCERRYCSEHRLLWRECDTAIMTSDGAGEKLWELRGCPACEWEEKEKKYIRERENANLKEK